MLIHPSPTIPEPSNPRRNTKTFTGFAWLSLWETKCKNETTLFQPVPPQTARKKLKRLDTIAFANKDTMLTGTMATVVITHEK